MSPPPIRPWQRIAALGHLAGFLSASFLIDRIWRAAGATSRAIPSPLQTATGLPSSISPEGVAEWTFALIRGALIPASLEELFFRGLIFEILRRAKGELAAIFVSAGLFALAHPGLPHTAAAGLLGLYLGTLRARWGLALPIAAHALNNALALLFSEAAATGAGAGDGLVQGIGLADPGLWLAIGLVGNSAASLRQEMRTPERRILQQNTSQDENGR